MKSRLVLLALFFCSTLVFAQGAITGIVMEKDEKGNEKPLIGANIIWAGTSNGTSSDINGNFKISLIKESNKLIVSFIGYSSDTLIVEDQRNVKVVLESKLIKVTDVEIIGEQQSSYLDFLGTENTTIITQKELQKAACCNLSESFETNPSVDVSFTDAITGAKQIEMLGLSGIYTQTTMESLPFMRGLMTSVGLTFVPGTWINAINVSKGIGSVVNGYESITGQIDIDMQKPFSEEEKPVYFNFYADSEQRIESNLNFRHQFSERLSSMTLLHASSRRHIQDRNSDRFIDMPTFNTVNLMQRWHYESGNGWEGQLGFQLVNEKKEGGTMTHSSAENHSDYRYGTTNRNFNIYGKTGYVFNESYKSFGIQWSFNNYQNTSFFGLHNYEGAQKNGYVNFIYQSILGEETHKFRTGLSFLFDEYDELFQNKRYQRIERVPGVFFEYTFKPNNEFSLVAGIRGDSHNYYGFMLTPRLHIRYAINDNLVFRAAAGRGYRTSNIFVEYASSFASARNIYITQSNNFGYGLDQESAWNYGFNATYYFLHQYREATLSLDFYRTEFEKVTIADIDSNPQSINFYSTLNGAYSNSVQLELNIKPLLRFDARIAYRFLDVKQKINNSFVSRPLTAQHRALFNFAHKTNRETYEDPQMFYDLTLQWFGVKRIPSTKLNPAEFQVRENSPSFVLINLQITRTFYEGFDLYLGVENLLNFRQDNPIISATNPNEKYFDASLIWGPVNGRMIYTGLRYKL